MTFYEVLEEIIVLLQRHRRVSYRALRRQFNLDDAYLEDVKAEIIAVQQLAVDQDGSMLVWAGDARVVTTLAPSTPLQSASPQAMLADQRLPVAPLGEPQTLVAERRQLTVMFCDLVGSTELASRLDPEDLREVLRMYQETCTEVIRHFEGYIAQYLGDGLLVYFGYPQAHEDGAHRAVYTGLGIIDAMRTLQTRLEQEWGVRVTVRLGIHTGLVVVGDIGEGARKEQLALGETPNVAARLQSVAAPNTVLISAATHHLVQGSFACQLLDAQALKGVVQPMAVYQVLQSSWQPSSLDTIRGGLTPLVGRELEVTLLHERWAQVKDSMGQVVVLSGEAGIGKSRLVQVLKEHATAEPHMWLECRCSPYHQNTALYPAIDLLQRVLQWQRDDPPDTRLQKLETALTPYHLALAEAVPLTAALLSLPLPADRYPSLFLTPQHQKQKTFEVMLTLLLELASQQPVLLLVEDLHWVDPSTLDFLTLLVDQAPTTRLCILLTCRPMFRAPWEARAHIAQLTLSRLRRHQVEQMVKYIAGGKTLPPEVVQQVVTRTDGVPLFVEELTKTILASGWLSEREGHYELSGFLPALAIPATLHDSLMARLDRMVTAKGVAQLAAALGRRFHYALLHAVSPLDEATLQRELRQLVAADLVYQQGLPPHAVYMFKHVLIQEAAYQSLLKSTRQHYHQQIAQVLAARFPETAVTQPELLAHHYTEAGLPAQAIPYWLQAGQGAVGRSANAEAIGHLTRGLEVLKTLPETPESIQQELTFLLALCAPLSMLRGHTAPEVERVYTRAQELCRQAGDSEQLFVVLRNFRGFFLDRAQLQTAREFGEQCFALAQRLQNPFLLQEAHMMLGSTLFYQGEFVSARAYLEQGIAMYDIQHRRLLDLRRTDSGVMCLAHVAWTLWMLGYPEHALTRSQEACTLAQQLSHAYSLGFALHFAGTLYQYRREVQPTQEQADAVMALAREQGFVRWLAGGMVRQGWVLAQQGAVAQGIEQIQQGLSTWRTMGGALGLPHFLARLAEAYGKGGQAAAGLDVVAEALAMVHQHGQQYYEAELHRLKGELLLQSGANGPASEVCVPPSAIDNPHAAEAEACLQQALDIACRQQARFFELRAVMSLSRLWQQQGKREAARQRLAEIYDWFTEGFDTPDLQDARALLETLR
jgi:class 3 adenylate cyclase/predicted ATPase